MRNERSVPAVEKKAKRFFKSMNLTITFSVVEHGT